MQTARTQRTDRPAEAPPPRLRRILVRGLRLLVHIFFRDVEVVGRESVPATGGGVYVAWHPNGLVDGLLILATSPRPVVFGARHGLFEVPVLGWLLRSIGTVELYRAQDSSRGDDEARREANRRSLDNMARAAATSFAAIFPEGVTHDEPQLQTLRHGAARLFYAAAERPEAKAGVRLIAVGLHYDKKHAFRSRALVTYHSPIDVEPLQREADEGERRGHVAALTERIDKELRTVVRATESWKLHLAMERIRKLVRAERSRRAGSRLGASDMKERELGFARVWVAYQKRRSTHPRETDDLLLRARRYDELLRMLRLEDRDLDHRPRTLRRIALLGLEAAAVFFVLPPLVFFGYLVNLPTALAVRALARRLSKTAKEQAGLKVMLGTVAFTLTWLAVGLTVGYARPSFWTRYDWTPQTPVGAAAAVFALCALTGALALHYHRLAADLARALRTLLTRSRRTDVVERLRWRRQKLYDDAMKLSRDLDLPGEVADDGSILVSPPPDR